MKNDTAHFGGIIGMKGLAVRVSLLLVAAAMLWPALTYAQGTMAGLSIITGRVTDPSKAAVPSATVDVTSVATGVTTRFQTNAAGLYRTTPLVPGVYTIAVKAKGFETFTQRNVVLQLGRIQEVDCQLQVGSSTQTVTVTATPPLVDTTTPTQATIVGENAVKNLPLINRTAGQLIGLTPGMFFTYVDNGSYGAPRFNEGVGDDFSFFVDGFPAGASRTNVDQEEVNPPAEAVQEVRVENGLSGESSGYAEGGSVYDVLKTGTSQYHGSLYWYIRNTALDTANFWSHTVLPDHWNMGGGSVGGPLLHHFGFFKSHPAFFFVNVEKDTESNPGATLMSVPTMAERNGDFNGVTDVYDPTTTTLMSNGEYTRQEFPGDIIPQSRIDPVTAKLLGDWPTVPASVTNPVNDFTASYANIVSDWRAAGKINWNMNEKDVLNFDLLYLKGNIGTSTVPGFQPFADPFGSHFYPEMSGLYGFSETHSFRSNLVNSASFEYRPRYWIPDFAATNPSKQWDQTLGIKGYVPGEDLCFPTFGFSGYEGLGPGFCTVSQYLSTVDYADNLSYVRGTHTFTFGGEVEEARPAILSANTPTGSFSFDTTGTALPPQVPGVTSFTGGDGFATFLLGWVSSASVYSTEASVYREWYFAPYFDDNWRLRPDLTVTYGLRWDIDKPVTMTYHGSTFSNPGVPAGNGFDPTAINPVCNCAGTVTFNGRNGVGSSVYNTDWDRIMPRVGFAFAPIRFHNRLAVRGGFGMYSIDPSLGDNHPVPALGFGANASFSTLNEGAATSPVFYMKNGFPPYPTGSNPSDLTLTPGFGAVAAPYTTPTTAVGFVPRDWQLGYVEDLGLSIDYELPHQVVIGARGQSELGRKLPTYFDLDQLAPSSGLWGKLGNFQADRPYPQYAEVANVEYPEGTDDWYGLTFEVTKHYSNGLSLEGSYQWAKGIGILGCESSYLCYLDRDPGAMYQASNAQTGMPYGRFNANFNYDLPWGVGRPFLQHGLASKVLGNWSISSIFTWTSGIPFGIGDSSSSLNCECGLGGRVDSVPNPPAPAHPLHSIQEWFNTAAYRAPAFGTIGQVAPVTLTGPAMFTWDAELYKSIHFGEQRSLKISAEFFNFTNTPVLGLPDATLGTPGFGVISGPLTAPYAGAGATNDDSARLVQLGLHLYF